VTLLCFVVKKQLFGHGSNPSVGRLKFFQQFLKLLSLVNKSSCFIVCILLLLLLILAKR